jgi:hypothetical protein
VHVENGAPRVQLRPIHDHSSIEAPRP